MVLGCGDKKKKKKKKANVGHEDRRRETSKVGIPFRRRDSSPIGSRGFYLPTWEVGWDQSRRTVG